MTAMPHNARTASPRPSAVPKSSDQNPLIPLCLSAAAAAILSFAAISAQTPATPRTVWDGVFTTEQAARGRLAFSGECAECHGPNLEGGEGKALSGDQFWKDWKERSVDELLTFVRTNMPFDDAGVKKGTLPQSTYADIVAHILNRNGFPAGNGELNQASSAGVQIIRKDGPGELPDSATARVVGCLGPREGADWVLTKGTRAVRTSSPKDSDKTMPLGNREYSLKFVLTNLTRLVGHRVAVSGLLIGEGGARGINVSAVDNLADVCN
jgi:mono/diheme cytochrome c family protein